MDAYFDSGYEISAMLDTLFTSDFFKNDEDIRFIRVKSPAELVASTLRLTGEFANRPRREILDRAMQMNYMGQTLNNPPSVEGWHQGMEWIDTGTLVERLNFATAQLGDVSKPGVRAMISRVASESDGVIIVGAAGGHMPRRDGSGSRLRRHARGAGDIRSQARGSVGGRGQCERCRRRAHRADVPDDRRVPTNSSAHSIGNDTAVPRKSGCRVTADEPAFVRIAKHEDGAKHFNCNTSVSVNDMTQTAIRPQQTVVEHEPVWVKFKPLEYMDDEAIAKFSALNPELRIERTAEGEIVVMPPAFSNTGSRNARINTQLGVWTERNNTGDYFDSSAGFKLPNGALRSPDASWISNSRLDALTTDERSEFYSICPDFVIELRSASDSLRAVQAKMQEYMDNGSRLGWLIDPLSTPPRVHVYRPGAEVEILGQS